MDIFNKLKRRIEVFTSVFTSDSGKEVLQFLEHEIQPYATKLSSVDPYQIAYNEGRRSVYNYIVQLAGQSPDVIQRYIQRQKEHEELQKLVKQDADLFS